MLSERDQCGVRRWVRVCRAAASLNNSMQRTALRAAADAERWLDHVGHGSAAPDQPVRVFRVRPGAKRVSDVPADLVG